MATQFWLPQFHARPSQPVKSPIRPAAGAIAGKFASVAPKSRSKSPVWNHVVDTK